MPMPMPPYNYGTTTEEDIINFVIHTEREKGNYDTMNKDNFKIYHYLDYKYNIISEYLSHLPEGMRMFFNLNDFILHQWRHTSCEGNGEFYIVYKDIIPGFVSYDIKLYMLEGLETIDEIWKGNVKNAFNALCDKCWIVEYHP